jgi:homoserine kinase type II
MAVYTEVGDGDLAAFIASYGLGRLLSYKGIAEGVENTNYLVHAERGTFILTLYEKRVEKDDLPFFLGLMEHLAARGLTCLSGRPAAMVTFLEGVWIRRPQVAHCAALGRALAELHKASDGFPLTRANALGPSGWAPLFQRFQADSDEIVPGLRATITSELADLATLWPKDLPHGVIHADLFPDNAFFLGDDLSGIIDFYFACNDVLAYDVAICLNAWCFEPDHSFNITKAQALLRAYHSVRPLSAAEQNALPIFARGSALRFLLTRGYDWINTPANALVSPKDPMEYLRKLRFHQSVTSPSAYGLA